VKGRVLWSCKCTAYLFADEKPQCIAACDAGTAEVKFRSNFVENETIMTRCGNTCSAYH
jgi:hypothetical protein